ncbi:hypothetical protein ACMFBX_00280 [Escherichia coli]
MESNIKGLVAAGHEMASELKAECGAVDMRSVAKLISDLATQLEVQLVRANALAAENALARKAVQAFCEVVGDNTEIISELVGQDDVLVILKAMKATGNMSATDASWLKYVRRHATRGLTIPPAVLLLRSITDLSISLCVKFSTLHA